MRLNYRLNKDGQAFIVSWPFIKDVLELPEKVHSINRDGTVDQETYDVVGLATRAICSNNVSSAIIPDSFLYIDPNAFYKCPNLKKVTIGAGLKEFNNDMFFECNNLESVEFINNEKYFSENGIVYASDTKELVFCPPAAKVRSPESSCRKECMGEDIDERE